MSVTAHVYQVYVRATPEQVWTAITDSDWTRRWFHATAFVAQVEKGQPYRTVLPSGDDAVDGFVEELEPPSDGRPGRFVQTWHVLYDAAMAAEPPSRVEWTVEAAGPGLTRVRLVHGNLAASPLTWSHVEDGWVWVLDSLKTVLETGEALPDAEAIEAQSPPGEEAWHRSQAVSANNTAFALLDTARRSPDEDEELVRTAYAAAYHWARAAGRRPANAVRADYLVAKALLATDQAAESLRVAERMLRRCAESGLVDFDLAYAHEIHARALRAVGRVDAARAAWSRALTTDVVDPEDAAIVRADLALDPVT